MPKDQINRRIEEWNRIKAFCHGAAEEPLIVNESIASCLCDAVPLSDRLRMAGRYLIIGLAQIIPLSPVKVWLLRRVGTRIGRDVFISPGVVFDPLFPQLITIEDGALLGLGCRLITHEYTATNFRLGRIHIGKSAVVGGWAMVRSGVRVGAGATVGAYSFVNKDVPDGETVAGIPARPIAAKQPEQV